MRRLVIILLLMATAPPSFGAACPYASYTYYRAITIAHSTVPATLTNFPFLLQGTFTWLKTVANGGRIEVTGAGTTAPSAPYDLVFCDNIQGTQLSHEVDNYNGTTGVASFWISLPTLSSTVDTTFYALYNNASAVSSPEAASTVWSNAGYVSVYHFTDQSTNLLDSGPGANHLTFLGAHSSVTGQIGPAIAGGSTSGTAYKSTPTGLPSGTEARSMEVWVNWNSGGTGNNPPAVVFYGEYTCGTFTCSHPGESWTLQFPQADSIPLKAGVYDTPCAFAEGGSTCSGRKESSGSITAGAGVWHKIIGQSAAGNTDMANATLYVDGAVRTTVMAGGEDDAINTSTTQIRIGAAKGCGDNGGTSCFYGEPMDEFRIAGVVFDANWNQYEYCNDTNGCTATPGPETNVPNFNIPYIFITTQNRENKDAGNPTSSSLY